jgi:uncharacterized protein YndB with AHSA1/START domain
MSNDTQADKHVVGTLRSVDGTGVVRMEDRYDTGIDDLWSALTEPHRLARWIADVEATSGSAVNSTRTSPAAGRALAEWTCANLRSDSG